MHPDDTKLHVMSGMNTINGLESSPLAFYFLLGGSAAASALALGGVMRHLRYKRARAGRGLVQLPSEPPFVLYT